MLIMLNLSEVPVLKIILMSVTFFFLHVISTLSGWVSPFSYKKALEFDLEGSHLRKFQYIGCICCIFGMNKTEFFKITPV